MLATAARYLPPLVLMGVIFWLSAQPSLDSGLGVWDTVLRKIAHMLEFGVLWWLWWRALRLRSPVPATVIALAYAISDELHQSFVDGRFGSPVDVAIDAAGIGFAGLIVIAHHRMGGEKAARPEPAGAPPRRGDRA
ncbi:MAG: VanZ family protein [Solirubrobacterales bacterium]|nr:VanZ family protein [Solirubrobacterales bacterium]